MIAVNAAPGSCPGSISSPTTRTCALEEIGRNSVKAWTRPRTTASMNDMGSPRTTRGSGGAAATTAGLAQSTRRRAVGPAPRSGAVVKITWRCRGGPRRYGGSAAGLVPVVLVVVEVVEVVEVVVIVVIVEDDQRRGDLVGVEEGVVVGVEGRGELLGGRIESGVVVTARGGSGLVVTFEGGDQRSKSGARIR